MSLLKPVGKILFLRKPDNTSQIYMVLGTGKRELLLDCHLPNVELGKAVAQQTARHFGFSIFEEEIE